MDEDGKKKNPFDFSFEEWRRLLDQKSQSDDHQDLQGSQELPLTDIESSQEEVRFQNPAASSLLRRRNAVAPPPPPVSSRSQSAFDMHSGAASPVRFYSPPRLSPQDLEKQKEKAEPAEEGGVKRTYSVDAKDPDWWHSKRLGEEDVYDLPTPKRLETPEGDRLVMSEVDYKNKR